MNATCADLDIDAWKLEKYWRYKSTGDVDVLPEWTYSEALQHITTPPEEDLDAEETLNSTVMVPHGDWLLHKMTLEYLEEQEALHARYGYVCFLEIYKRHTDPCRSLVLLVAGFVAPIVLTFLGHLGFDKVKSYLVYPSLIGTYQARPLPYLLGNAPAMGQSLYIAMFAILTVVLTAVDYRSTQPNTLYASTYQEIMGYVSCRSGVLAFALAPLVILFAGRNNILLWLTDWSHSTYMVLHRWIARIFAVQVIVHSIAELVLQLDTGEYAAELVTPYWAWGAVATLATCIMLVSSMLFVRRRSYEVFLITHVVLAIFVLAGCWYHVEYRFHRQWGYEYWLYAACAVWFADRLVRVLRIANVGLRRATVVAISDHIVRVDVAGVHCPVTPGHHAYVFFPTLHRLRPWENHPFAVIPTALLLHHPLPATSPATSVTSNSSSSITDPEKHADLTTTTTTIPIPTTTTAAGISFYVKKSTGLTTLLFSPTRRRRPSLPTLLDGPYPSTSNRNRLTARVNRLVLIGGGIGITGLLRYLPHSPHGGGPAVELHWSVKARDEALVRELEPLLAAVALRERVVRVGGRVDVEGVLGRVGDYEEGRVGVVVCGPGGLCDRVRAAVVEVGRGRGRKGWELEVCAFSW